MNKTLKSFLLVFFIFFVIIFISTYGLLNGYFEQDEWLAIANVMRSYNYPWWSFFVPGGVHFSPLGTFFWSTLYYVFKIQAQYYFLTELIVHASVSALVFILTERLTKSKTTAIIAGLLFLLNGRAHQAFTHLAIFHVTDTAMFFILLFFIYLSSIKEKVLSFKNVGMLFLIFLAAVSTREEGAIIIPIAAAYLVCFDRSKINRANIKFIFLFALGIGAFLAIRIFAQTLNTEPIPVEVQITGRGAEYNLVTVPLKFIVQNLIYSERIFIFLINKHQAIYPGMVKNIFVDAPPLMDAAFFYISSLVAGILAIWLWAIRPKRIGALLVFFSVWVLSNASILSFVGRPLYVLEPRYLYFSAFPVLCLVAIFSYTLFTSKSKYLLVSIAKKITVTLILAILLLTSFQEISVAVKTQVNDGVAKKQIFKSLLEVHPTLSNNTIFYVTCKNECYRNSEFGISTKNVLPFSSGPGMNILVTYASIQNQEKEWGPFFNQEFLFQTFSEGYKKIGDRSYGYFITKSKLEETLKRQKLSKDIVVALEIDEKDYTFRDISKSFRRTLADN